MNNKIKFCLSKERLLEIGKYINRQLIIHRNVEHDSNWTTEEKMIVQLYDFVVGLLEYITHLQKSYNNAINQSIVDHKYASKKEDEAIVLQEENKKLKEQLEYYKTKELERINKHLLDAKNNYLEGCIKVSKVGD